MSDETFTIEHVIGKRVKDGELQYRVAWKRFSAEGNSWEPVDMFDEEHNNYHILLYENMLNGTVQRRKWLDDFILRDERALARKEKEEEKKKKEEENAGSSSSANRRTASTSARNRSTGGGKNSGASTTTSSNRGRASGGARGGARTALQPSQRERSPDPSSRGNGGGASGTDGGQEHAPPLPSLSHTGDGGSERKRIMPNDAQEVAGASNGRHRTSSFLGTIPLPSGRDSTSSPTTQVSGGTRGRSGELSSIDKPATGQAGRSDQPPIAPIVKAVGRDEMEAQGARTATTSQTSPPAESAASKEIKLEPSDGPDSGESRDGQGSRALRDVKEEAPDELDEFPRAADILLSLDPSPYPPFDWPEQLVKEGGLNALLKCFSKWPHGQMNNPFVGRIGNVLLAEGIIRNGTYTNCVVSDTQGPFVQVHPVDAPDARKWHFAADRRLRRFDDVGRLEQVKPHEGWRLNKNCSFSGLVKKAIREGGGAPSECFNLPTTSIRWPSPKQFQPITLTPLPPGLANTLLAPIDCPSTSGSSRRNTNAVVASSSSSSSSKSPSTRVAATKKSRYTEAVASSSLTCIIDPSSTFETAEKKSAEAKTSSRALLSGRPSTNVASDKQPNDGSEKIARLDGKNQGAPTVPATGALPVPITMRTSPTESTPPRPSMLDRSPTTPAANRLSIEDESEEQENGKKEEKDDEMEDEQVSIPAETTTPPRPSMVGRSPATSVANRLSIENEEGEREKEEESKSEEDEDEDEEERKKDKNEKNSKKGDKDGNKLPEEQDEDHANKKGDEEKGESDLDSDEEVEDNEKLEGISPPLSESEEQGEQEKKDNDLEQSDDSEEEDDNAHGEEEERRDGKNRMVEEEEEDELIASDKEDEEDKEEGERREKEMPDETVAQVDRSRSSHSLALKDPVGLEEDPAALSASAAHKPDCLTPPSHDEVINPAGLEQDPATHSADEAQPLTLTAVAGNDERRNSIVLSALETLDTDQYPRFDWEKKLAQEGAIPAPLDSFWRRRLGEFENPFEGQTGRLLIARHFLAKKDAETGQEAAETSSDRRRRERMEQEELEAANCPAICSIKEVHGPWIKVGVVDAQSGYDMWHFYSDPVLHHIDDRDVRELKPPMQRLTPNNYKKVVDRMVKKYGGVPASCFEQRLQEANRPARNLFEPDHKLEAYGIYGADGFFWPGTVIAVDGEKVTIRVDGAVGQPQVMRFDDVRLFPCGFASAIGCHCAISTIEDVCPTAKRAQNLRKSGAPADAASTSAGGKKTADVPSPSTQPPEALKAVQKASSGKKRGRKTNEERLALGLQPTYPGQRREKARRMIEEAAIHQEKTDEAKDPTEELSDQAEPVTSDVQGQLEQPSAKSLKRPSDHTYHMPTSTAQMEEGEEERPVKKRTKNDGAFVAFFSKKCKAGPNMDPTQFRDVNQRIVGKSMTGLWQSLMTRLRECSVDETATVEKILPHHNQSEPKNIDFVADSMHFSLAAPKDLDEAQGVLDRILADLEMCKNAISIGVKRHCLLCSRATRAPGKRKAAALLRPRDSFPSKRQQNSLQMFADTALNHATGPPTQMIPPPPTEPTALNGHQQANGQLSDDLHVLDPKQRSELNALRKYQELQQARQRQNQLQAQERQAYTQFPLDYHQRQRQQHQMRQSEALRQAPPLEFQQRQQRQRLLQQADSTQSSTGRTTMIQSSSIRMPPSQGNLIRATPINSSAPIRARASYTNQLAVSQVRLLPPDSTPRSPHSTTLLPPSTNPTQSIPSTYSIPPCAPISFPVPRRTPAAVSQVHLSSPHPPSSTHLIRSVASSSSAFIPSRRGAPVSTNLLPGVSFSPSSGRMYGAIRFNSYNQAVSSTSSSSTSVHGTPSTATTEASPASQQSPPAE